MRPYICDCIGFVQGMVIYCKGQVKSVVYSGRQTRNQWRAMLFRVGTHGSCVLFFTDDDTFISCMYSLTPCVWKVKSQCIGGWYLGRTDRASLQRKMVPALVWGRKSGGAESGEKKRRLFERSEFLRFRREPLRSRPQTEAGVFSFCYLFLLDAQKKK